MKILTRLALGLGLSIWPLVIGCSQGSSDSLSSNSASVVPSSSLLESQAAAAETTAVQPAESVPPAETNTPAATNTPAEVAQADAAPSDAPSDAVTVTNLSDAPAKPMTMEKSTPPNVRATGPVVELAKLASSGVDESVLQAYIKNSTTIFNANADEIIYLNDLGISSSVVNAMLAHDQTLKDALAASMAASMAAATPPPGAVTPPPTDQYAPQPDNSMVPEQPAPEPPVSDVSDATFYDALSPYGNWVDVQGYGPCWQPTVVVSNPGWQPYFDCGHWVYTDCGWYWQSGYSWGWAPFHYGRWFHHNHLGWCWTPDTVWGASWVCWRYTEGYCGWAPLPPSAWYHHDTGLTFCGTPVGIGFGFGLTATSFHFVPWGHFHDHHLNNFAMASAHVNRVFDQSTAVTRISANGRVASNRGLSVDRVQAATHLAVHAVALQPTQVALAPDTSSRTLTTTRSSTRSVTVLQPPTQVASLPRAPRTPASAWTPQSPRAAAAAKAPPSSLVVIGRHDGTRQNPSAWNPYTHPYGNLQGNPRSRETANADSPTTDDANRNGESFQGRQVPAYPPTYQYQPGGGYPSARSAPSAPSARPAWNSPNYQAAPWMNRSQSSQVHEYVTPRYSDAAPEVPRYIPSPVQSQPRYQAEPAYSAPAAPQRTYSAPVAPSALVQAPAARSAPSAPVQNNSNTGRNGR